MDDKGVDFFRGLASYEPITLTILDQHTLRSKVFALSQKNSSLSNTAEETDYRLGWEETSIVSATFGSTAQPPLECFTLLSLTKINWEYILIQK